MWIVCYRIPDFGLACERKRRPELQGQPFAIVGADDTVLTASPEATEHGVRSGMAAAAARLFCEALTIAPYDLPAYNEMAEAIWNRIVLDSSFVEPLSPEECLAVFSGPGIMDRLHESVADIRRIADATVHTGMAKSRFTARIAALRDPGNSPVVVRAGSETDFLKTCSIEAVTDHPIARKSGGRGSAEPYGHQGHSGGRGSAEPPLRAYLDSADIERLNRLGIHTLGDVLAIDETDLHRQFREKGFQLRRLAQGLDRNPVRALWPPTVAEHRLRNEEGIENEAMLDSALRICAERISADLQRLGRQCRRITLTLILENGAKHSETEQLRKPADQADSLLQAARRLYRRYMDAALSGGRGSAEPHAQEAPDHATQRNKVAGHAAEPVPDNGTMSPVGNSFNPLVEIALRASDIGLSDSIQPVLIDDNEYLRGLPHERKERLDTAIQLVKERFGADRIAPASNQRFGSRPFRLWTYPLTRRLNEAIEVVTDQQGNPVRYGRSGTWREVRLIQNRWSEAEWRMGKLEERMVFRIEEISAGLVEMQRHGDRWRLTAVAD